MFIVMHCGGIPFNGDTIKHKSLGGSETAAYYVARELAALGHKVTLFTASQESGVFDGVKYEWHGECTEAAPLGDRYTFYVENTPHDICIAQRHPRAFERKIASKLNYWWLHDLALGRIKPIAMAQMWNIDRILCVSNWHKKQIVDTWGLDPDVVLPITNGIDLSLFDGQYESKLVDEGQINLLYSSRPERGLANLVCKGGIMERLAQEMPEAHLYVCGYENTTPQMAPLYESLYRLCDELPNVTRLGALTKRELADTMRQCDALVYPTQFEEVSCITAMEAMAAGLPFISSQVAALPETCHDSHAKLIPLDTGGGINVGRFVAAIRKLPMHHDLREQRKAVAKKFEWKHAAAAIVKNVRERLLESSENGLLHHYLRHSDIVAFEGLAAFGWQDEFSRKMHAEFAKGYAFYRENTYAEHYAAYYQYEKDRGVEYGPEDVTETARFRVVASHVAQLKPGSHVLDYGCAHGHFTVPLARLFPKLFFVGVDLAQSNVDTAAKWAADEGLQNIRFYKTEGKPSEVEEAANMDLIIAAEVLEHVGNPQEFIDGLGSMLNDGGKMVITTPYGPWEAQGYRQHGYWRAHLHHFERADLHEMLGHFKNFNITVAPAGYSQFATPIGSYITAFDKPHEPAREIDYARKAAETVPDQTLSCCMIVKDAEADLRRCLDSVLPYVQEVVIGIDRASGSKTRELIDQIAEENPLVLFQVFPVGPAAETGFAAMRNETIARASCDWVLWIDSDEVLVGGHTMVHYLRRNQYGGYAVEQHHWSMDPMRVIQVDLPCRLFRNFKDVKFFGLVHEHPEVELNKGLGQVMLLPKVKIAHYGYKDENTRRRRFVRNIGLLTRDRQENPDRLLGKFLWIRDLCQSCLYDIEAGNVDFVAFEHRINEGVALWEELLRGDNLRITVDSLQFYSKLVEISGQGFDFTVEVGAAREPGKALPQKVQGFFKSEAHALMLMEKLAKDKFSGITSRYY